MTSPPLLWLDFRRHPSDPGCFPLLVPTWSVTRQAHPGDTAAAIRECQPQFLCFEFDTPSADELTVLQKTHLQYPGLPVLVVTDSVSPAFTEWVFRLGIWDCLVKPVTADDLNACIEAFAHFCVQRHHTSAPSGDCCAPRRPPRTSAARDYVASHFASELRLAVVASLCHLSESEFSRCFKKENGLTFSEYLMHCRIQKACDLLGESAVQVKAVAFEVGFNDVSYFARAFRRLTGTTPSAYQQQTGAPYHRVPVLASGPKVRRPLG